MLGSVGFLWMNLQTLKTRSDGREVAQDSRGKPDGLMVMRKLVVLNAGQFRQTRTIGLTSGWWWGESEKGNQEYPNNSDFWWLNQFSSVTQSCLTICDPMDCNMPGFPVHHQFPDLAQTHVHWVGDAIQQSHPLLSPSAPAFNLSQHQGLFQRVGCSH